MCVVYGCVCMGLDVCVCVSCFERIMFLIADSCVTRQAVSTSQYRSRVMQCVAACCSVLQRVAACCSHTSGGEHVAVLL